MPCRDYEDDRSSTARSEQDRSQRDRLARIACAAMTELEDNGIAEAILLRNDEVREWWEAHKIADAKAKAEKERKAAAAKEKARLKKLRKDLIAKLSPDERKALGV